MNHGGRNAVGRGNAEPVTLWFPWSSSRNWDRQFSKERLILLLLNEADHWWDATSCILKTTMPTNDHITWEMFKNAFNEKYFLDRVSFKMERDFLSLKQGNKSITEHGTQFKKHNNGGSKGSEKTLGDTPFKKNLLPCQRCGGTHAREFYMITRACFGCGKMDHKIKDCPKRHYDLDTA
ncbi:hypothetical protein LWI28_024728 [Acer negundo]|uniref:CCHC-type domain-containing protein n=1 Tax=Acer negundo TaxID=4023 RepID=A0AAD5NWK8_ACENE|nr:hypothetical protein LWI28_024728 [Acer negundo]